MKVFLSVLFLLLSINTLLLAIRINVNKKRYGKPIKRILEAPVIRSISEEASETKYKKAP